MASDHRGNVWKGMEHTAFDGELRKLFYRKTDMIVIF